MGSIEKIHEMLVSKECSCTELTKSYLDEIEKADGELNAYVNVTGEEALKTAEAVDRKIASGEKIGYARGCSVTLKDNISTKGIETTCCSKILTGYKPIYNSNRLGNSCRRKRSYARQDEYGRVRNGLFMRNIILWRCNESV